MVAALSINAIEVKTRVEGSAVTYEGITILMDPPMGIGFVN